MLNKLASDQVRLMMRTLMVARFKLKTHAEIPSASLAKSLLPKVDGRQRPLGVAALEDKMITAVQLFNWIAGVEVGAPGP